MLRHAAIFFPAVLIAGCLDSRPGNNNSPVIQEPPKVTINVPSDSDGIKADFRSELAKAKDEIRTEIQTSSNNTQSNMSGLVNASVSKLGEKVTGVESKVEASATATANLSAKVTGVEAKVDSNIAATANVNAKAEASLTAVSRIDARVEAVATMINDIKVEIGKVNANAQVGYNKMEQIEEHVANVAGRDVNYLPKQAVQLMLGIITSLCGLATTVVLVIGRNARVRERLDAERERKNSRHWQEVALKAISSLGPDKTRDILSASRRDIGEPSSAPSRAESIATWAMEIFGGEDALSACMYLGVVLAFSAFIWLMITMVN